jgi:cytochrome c oxidase subunit II
MKTSWFTAFAVALVVTTVQAVPSQSQERTIEVHAKRFAFSPAEITVKKGETVTLSLISDDVPHSLLISELGVNAAMVKGHPTQVQMTANKTGDFTGRCGKFCGSGHGQMHFVVHVAE